MLGSAGGSSDPKSPAIRMLMKDVTKGVKGELPVRGEPVGSASAGGSASCCFKSGGEFILSGGKQLKRNACLENPT